jgi:hypothetical protein
MTINEGREIYGYEALEGGDQSVLAANTNPMQFDEVNKLSDLNEQKKQGIQFQQEQARASASQPGNAGQGSGNGAAASPNGSGKTGGPNTRGTKPGGGNGSKPVGKASRTMAFPRAALRNKRAKPRSRTATTASQHKDPKRVKRLARVLAEAFKKQGKKVSAAIVAGRTRHATQKAVQGFADIDLSDQITFSLQKAADDPQDLMRDGWDEYYVAINDIMEEAAVSQAKDIYAQAELDPGADENWDSINESVVNLARTNSARMLGMEIDDSTGELTPNANPQWAVSDDVRDSVSDLVAQAEAEDWSNADLADAIEGSASFSPERADLVARTELKNIDSQSAYEAASGAGAEQMEWNLSGDHDDEDECDDNDEVSPIGIDEEWPSGEPAVHPRCQCTVTYVWPGDESGDAGEE